MILLLYCNRVPPAANTRTAGAATAFECRMHAGTARDGMREVATVARARRPIQRFDLMFESPGPAGCSARGSQRVRTGRCRGTA